MAPTIRRLRIGHFTSRYPIPSHAFVAREVRELRRLGAEVDTFTVKATQDLAGLSADDRAEVASTVALRPLSPLRLVSLHVRALARHPRAWLRTLRRAVALREHSTRGVVWQLFYFAQAIVFAELCRERRLNHVHVHHANVAADVTLLAAHFGRASSTSPQTWSMTIHGPTEFLDARRFRPAQKAHEADLVIVTSDHARQTLEGLAGRLDHVRLLRLGVDLDRFQYRPPREDRCLRVLNVAQLVARKGQADLLEAVARLRDAGLEVDLTLVGGGEDRARLEARARDLDIADRVTFRGALGQDDVVRAYAEADVFCLTSYAEGQPVVLMEAMACGLPVVATRVAGTPELVLDDETGLLVDAGRPDQVADALGRLARDAALRQRLSVAARERIEAEHDFHRLVAALRDLIAGTAVS